ncbi:hypothetical protein AAC387_Pa07g1654 [Persea americana]
MVTSFLIGNKKKKYVFPLMHVWEKHRDDEIKQNSPLSHKASLRGSAARLEPVSACSSSRASAARLELGPAWSSPLQLGWSPARCGLRPCSSARARPGLVFAPAARLGHLGCSAPEPVESQLGQTIPGLGTSTKARSGPSLLPKAQAFPDS